MNATTSGATRIVPDAIEALDADELAPASVRLMRAWQRTAERIARKLAAEPLDTAHAIRATLEEIFWPYLDGERDADAVRRHLVAMTTAATMYPTARDMEQRVKTAHHEAAHAVIAYVLGVPFLRVSIEPSPIGGSLGHVQFAHWFATDGARTDLERLELERYAVVDMAGPAAEDERGTSAPRETWDIHRADVRRALRQIRPALNGAAIRSLAEYLEHRARGLVADHWPAITALAEALQTTATLNGSMARAIIAAALDTPPQLPAPLAPPHSLTLEDRTP